MLLGQIIRVAAMGNVALRDVRPFRVFKRFPSVDRLISMNVNVPSGSCAVILGMDFDGYPLANPENRQPYAYTEQLTFVLTIAGQQQTPVEQSYQWYRGRTFVVCGQGMSTILLDAPVADEICNVTVRGLQLPRAAANALSRISIARLD